MHRISLFFFLLLVPSLSFAQQPAKELFGRKTSASHHQPEAIGTYAKGCVAGAVQLAETGPTWQAMRLSRNRNWGHPDVISFIERLSRSAVSAGWKGDQRNVNANWTRAHHEILKAAASDPAVARIFVTAPAKLRMCKDAARNDRAWLRKIRPWWGHHYHFHVRLNCPAGSRNCQEQAAIPPGDGCKEAVWWVTDALKPPDPNAPKKKRKPKAPITLAHAADLVERGQYDWTEDDPNFGGMSGLWIAPGGERLIAISDRGYFARAKIERSNKVITNIKADEITPIPLVKDRPVQRFMGGEWDEDLSIPRSKRFLVVGADFGPDGRLYVLERDFDVISAFKTRIRRFTLSKEGFDAGETLLETRFSALGNAEGISLWTDADGQTVITLISDDNFNGFQKTWVTEYTLVE